MPFPNLDAPIPLDRAALTEFAHAAAGLLVLAEARIHGLIDGGRPIDRQRCFEILLEAADQDVYVRVDQAADEACTLARLPDLAILGQREAVAGAA